MKKDEYIRLLEKELKKLPPDERTAAVEFYNEIFMDAGEENEESMTEELGAPKKVAAQIKAEYATKQLEDENITQKKRIWSIWWIILGICSAPISIPLAAAGVILAISFVILLLALFVAGVLMIICFLIVCVYSMWIGITAITVSLSTAVMLIGAGLLGIGVTAIMLVGLFELMILIVKKLVLKLQDRKKRKRAMKSQGADETSVWAYRDEDNGTSSEKGEVK